MLNTRRRGTDFNFISSEACFSAYLSKIKDIVDRSDCECGSSLFYDSSEVSRFINTLDELIYVTDYLIGDPSILIHELLKNSTDWTDKPVHKAQYFLWDFGNPFAQQNMPPSVNEAVEYQIGDSNVVLLNLSFDFQKNKRFIFIIKDTSTHEDYMLPSFTQIEQIHDFNGLTNWLSINRTPRKLNIERLRCSPGTAAADRRGGHPVAAGDEGCRAHARRARRSAPGAAPARPRET